MKKITTTIAALILAATSFAQTWNVDKAHAKLGFTITHLMVSDVDGMFKNFEATITSSKPDFSDASFNLNINTGSVFTDNDKRDEHLRSADFFDVSKYPNMVFQSTSVTKSNAGTLKVKGNLTLHGVTRPVTLDVVIKGPTTHPMTKKPVAGFKVTGTIKRSDFKIGDSFPSAMLSDEVQIVANGEFQQG
jgi:polyisoprenoid-binding protein YceI